MNRFTEIEKAYLTVCVPLPVAITDVSRVSATSIPWRGDGSGDGAESDSAESCCMETQQSFARAFRPRVCGMGRATRCNFLRD